MLHLPPALFPFLSAAHDRVDHARRYWAMVENEHLGVKVSWIGEGAEPKSSYHYDHGEREKYIDWLRERAGLPDPNPAPADPFAQDRAAWQALRQRRRMKA